MYFAHNVRDSARGVATGHPRPQRRALVLRLSRTPSSAIRLPIAGNIFLLQLAFSGNTLTGTPEVGFHGDSLIMVKTALLLTLLYLLCVKTFFNIIPGARQGGNQ